MDNLQLEKLVETEQRSKSNTKRIDILEEKQDDIHTLALSVKELAMETKEMRKDINKIDERVHLIEDKPAKRLDLIWGYIVSTIIGGLIAYLFVKLGLKG